jgi:hypothetical protein
MLNKICSPIFISKVNQYPRTRLVLNLDVVIPDVWWLKLKALGGKLSLNYVTLSGQGISVYIFILGEFVFYCDFFNV